MRISRKQATKGIGQAFKAAALASCMGLAPFFAADPARADETCQSPYMAKITGEEEYVYVWTLGMDGVGDSSDKLVTIDVREGSPSFGEVIASTSVGGQHEAHHGGYTDDRRFFWVSGLDTSMIFIFDVHTDPANPKLVKTIEDFEEVTGLKGPHGAYAMPGRMLISALSNPEDLSGRTGIAEYTNEGEYIATHWMPVGESAEGLPGAEFADGYGYDARVLPRRNVMLSSSFTGWENYMRPVGEVVSDPEAMKKFGQSMVVWDLHARKPKQVLHVPGVPLEIRWAWGEGNDYAFTSTALTSKLVLVHDMDGDDMWEAVEVADIGNPEDLPLPVDISISADDSTLFVDSMMDGMVRVFDVSDPFNPSVIYEKKIGKMVNMVSQSWDGERVYFTSSLLSNWDKQGPDGEQFLRAFTWNGEELHPRFEIDFEAEELGRPHIMRFGAESLYSS